MVDYTSYFKGKKITVLGLGLLGRGVGDVALLAECGAELIVTDKKTKEELQSSLDTLAGYSNITYVLGEHRMEDFEGRDMILVAAGVPLDSPYVAHAREEGTGIVQSAALFTLLSHIPVIGVTGTRGKSTVTHMIHHALCEILEHSDAQGLYHSDGMVGSKTGCGVLLGGNVRGASNLQLLKEVREDSLAVMELDSWQLQGFGWAKISPQIAVFTNFMEDHLNYYGAGGKSHEEAMEAYFADKAQIFEHQGEGATFITTPTVFERASAYMKRAGKIFEQEVVLVDASTLPEDFLVPVPGEHNRENAALAFEALKAIGLTEEEALAGLSTFTGVEGRLQYLGDVNGVRVYNDNNATTPQATIVGLRAVAQGKNVILIAGGAYKEVDPSPLVPVMEEHCKKVVLIPGTGTDALLKVIGENSTINRTISDVVSVDESLEKAVQRGLTAGAPGDVLLFSPGFASFGMFKNEYDRNDQFVKILQSYQHETL